MISLKGKHFLKLLDFTPAEITGLLDLSAELKAKKKAGIPHRLCEGKSIALLFEKDSTRTRCAFEVAAADLGMHPVYLGPTGSQMGKKESIADTARVLGRMFDGIEYRGFGQEIVEELAAYAGVPVWNGLTDQFHPTQILADFPDFDITLAKTYVRDYLKENLGSHEEFTIYNVAIAKYLSSGVQRTIVFQAAVSWKEEGTRTQKRYDLHYTHLLSSTAMSVAANCPNCGGILGYGETECSFCNSRVANVLGNSWEFTELRES